MRYPPRGQNRAPKRILAVATIWLCALCLFFLLPSHFIFAASPNPQTTVADFNAGQFYHTGLTRTTAGGGDGDGEVRLLTLGIAPSTWKSNGNVNGLPALNDHAAVQYNGQIYVSGGIPFANTGRVYFATINTATDHNLTNWTETTALTGTRNAHGMVVVNNFMYVIGGYEGITLVPTAIYAPVLSGGGVGSWTVASALLPTPLAESATVVVNGWIYVLGGFSNSGTVDTVYYAKPDPGTGNITSWNTASVPLKKVTQMLTAAVDNGAIYVMGGKGNSNSYADVYYGIPDSNTGNITSWSPDLTPLQNNLILASATTFAGQLYVAGGAFNNGTALTNTIESNLIDPSRSFSTPWVNSDVLSTPRQRAPAVMSNDGWMYVIEGLNNTNQPLHTIDYGPTVSTGGGQFVPSGNYTSPVLDMGAPGNITEIDWNSTVTDTNLVSMALSYRVGNSSDLSSVPYSAAYGAGQGSQVQNVIPVPPGTTAQYIQYFVTFTSNRPDVTPVLNSVYEKITLPPDFTISNINPPALGAGSSPAWETIHVLVANLAGGGNFNAPIQQSTSAIVTQQSGPRGARRIPPGGVTVPKTSAGTTSSFFYVDVYVKEAPNFVLPTNAGDLGNCPNSTGGTNFASVQHLAAGTWVNVPVNCWLTPNQRYTFYAQVDTCDDPNQVACTFASGYVLERNEHNNIFGPTLTPLPGSGIFLPLIRK